jgi:hypothetical protein
MYRIAAAIVIVGFAAAGGLALSGAPDGQADLSKQVLELTDKVARLEARVQALEESLRKITVRIPQQFPELKELPKGWEKRYFNGIPYYIIPIEKSDDKAKIVR